MGRRLNECVAGSAAGEVQLDQAWRREEYHARVRLTTLGSVGDSGMASARSYLFLRGRSLEELAASDEIYRLASGCREIRRAVSRVTLATHGRWLGLCAGIDGGGPLPPFIPLGRNQDGLFRLTLGVVEPGSLTAHLPETVLHAPPEARAYGAEGLRDGFARLTLADIVGAVLTASGGGGRRDAMTRLDAAGTALERIGALSMRDYRDEVGAMCAAFVAAWLARLEQQLGDHPRAAASWRRDVEAQIDGMVRVVARSEFPVSTDTWPDAEPRARSENDQRLLREFGGLLRRWPEIQGLTRDLCDKGVVLGSVCES
jgi:hypothetical protein